MNSCEDRPSSDAIEDMLADSDFGSDDETALRDFVCRNLRARG